MKGEGKGMFHRSTVDLAGLLHPVKKSTKESGGELIAIHLGERTGLGGDGPASMEKMLHQNLENNRLDIVSKACTGIDN